MRYYYRCLDCLTTMTFEKTLGPARCGICGGRLEYLGPVVYDRWVKVEHRPKCDGRCISAAGPRCDCQCGGENHGAGLAGIVEVAKDGGPVRVTPSDARQIEAAKARAEEYRRLLAEAKELAKRTGWGEYHLVKIMRLRSHPARVKKLRELIDRYRGVMAR